MRIIVSDSTRGRLKLKEPIEVVLVDKCTEYPWSRIYIAVERRNEFHILTELVDTLMSEGWEPEPIVGSNFVSWKIYNALKEGYIPLTPEIYYVVDEEHVSIKKVKFDKEGHVEGEIIFLMFER